MDDAPSLPPAEPSVASPSEPSGGPSPTSSGNWRVFGASVPGARHVRTGRENQDAFLWQPGDGPEPLIAVAVADGHGSAEYARSRFGAWLAVEAAIDELLQLTSPGHTGVEATLSDIKRVAIERLPAVLIRRFEQQVAQHLAEHPVTPAELDRIEQQIGGKRRRYVERHPLRLYGATLLAVVVTDRYALFLQLGDGDILVTADDGAVTQPFPRDPRHIGNETASLVSKDAWGEMRIQFQAIAGAPPALVLLSTDGYSNSFSTPDAFLRVGSDVLALLREHGQAVIEREVSDWLSDAASIGGDDTTLVVVCRADALLSDNAKGESAPRPRDRADDRPAEESIAGERGQTASEAAAPVDDGARQESAEGPDRDTTEHPHGGDRR